MLFTKTAIVVASLVGMMLAQAAPPYNDTSLEIIRTEEVANGSTIYWYRSPRPSNISQSAVSARPNCGSNSVVCGTGNLAPVNLCRDMIYYLKKYPGTIDNPNQGPLAICQKNSENHQCCVAWLNGVFRLRQGWLVPAAEKTLNICKRRDGWISGLAHNVLLGDICTNQCLSNRPGPCGEG